MHLRGRRCALCILHVCVQTCELNIPATATAWSRQFAQFWWPWNQVPGSSPGLFSYIYHEYIPMYVELRLRLACGALIPSALAVLLLSSLKARALPGPPITS